MTVRQVIASLATFLGGSSLLSLPALAAPKLFSVTLTPSVAAYTGPCPVTIKFTGAISGHAGSKPTYQFARIVGGSPSMTPWTVGTIPPSPAPLTVTDSITVTAAQAGIETEALRVLQGPVSASVKVSVTCVNPTPTPTPTPKLSIVSPSNVFKPNATPTPKPGSATIANISALPTPLPPPINLAQVLPGPDPKVPPPACTAHGGSAGSFACYIALPAGKLVLVWDYPFPGPIDGYNVYAADAGGAGGMQIIQKLGGAKPLGTQHDPSVHLTVLDAPRPGACFAVTAFHGNDESIRSVRRCIGEGGIGKTMSFNPDTIGTMVVDYFYITYIEMVKQSNQPGNVRDLLSLSVGFTHIADMWRDNAHTDISGYMNSLFRGYVHFNTGALTGRTIAKAQLHLVAGATQGIGGGTTCLSSYGPANQVWYPGGRVARTASYGGSRIQGPDIQLDVTPIVQSWANSPAANKGIVLDGDQPEVIYQMVILSSTCLTQFSSETLDVTYY